MIRQYFRLLPLTMFVALMLLAVKLGQALDSGETLAEQFLIGTVRAEDAKKSEGEAKPAAAKEGEKPVEAKKEGEETPLLTPIFNAPKKEYKPEDLIGNQLGGTRPDDRRFSPVELQLLQQLSQRRKELDDREAQLSLKENLLTQTEKRIDEKFSQMESLKNELGGLIAQYNDIEETKIKSLVKIYENMKPQDAARIFDEVEMPVLLMVIDKMSEKKAAPILANMNAKKAKMVTVELAEQRRIQDEKIANQKAAPTPVVPLTPKPAPTPAPAPAAANTPQAPTADPAPVPAPSADSSASEPEVNAPAATPEQAAPKAETPTAETPKE